MPLSLAANPTMPLRHLSQLFLLAAIWGASFLFLRVAVPTLGPVWLIAGRIGFAALFLGAVAALLRQGLPLGEWRHFLVLGLLNTALPFLAYGFAARQLNASLMSILNATAPIWGAIIMASLQRRLPARSVMLGLLLGMLGVAVLVGFDRVSSQPGAAWAIGACLGATLCYGLASSYAKLKASHLAPFKSAHGSMWGATLLVLPLLTVSSPAASPTPLVWGAVLALAILCTGVAYLLYFRLVRDIGAASTLTVTFLIPIFGVLWGALLLGEHIGSNTLAGGLIILLGTALVTGFNPLARLRAAQPS
ncbi:DMT family transporter [Chitinibacter sp. ZOR0017]|uniref:DMT family transporter n=1 Tax=Chitinibacter sp. ZOR0017 TaxID=1339254 RepID=UPI000AE52D8C|nr:DMT family transporter [Chitinibacter sp. ZOR0017]